MPALGTALAALLTLALVATPLTAEAQQTGRSTGSAAFARASR